MSFARLVFAMFLAATLAFLGACSNSSGGQAAGGNKKGANDAQSGKDGPQGTDSSGKESSGADDTGKEDQGAKDDEGKEDEGKDDDAGKEDAGKDDDGKDDPKPTGGDPDEAAVCKFLKSAAGASKVPGEIAYLCDQGGLKKLAAKSDAKAVIVEDKQEGSISRITVAGAAAAKGTVAVAKKMGAIFCTSFSEYAALLPAAATKDIESIQPSNHDGKGSCEFAFNGKKILFFQPAFVGQQKSSVDGSGKIAVSINYLVTKKSLVEDTRNVAVLFQKGDTVVTVTVSNSTADAKGFHNQAKAGVIAATESGLGGFAGSLSKLK